METAAKPAQTFADWFQSQKYHQVQRYPLTYIPTPKNWDLYLYDKSAYRTPTTRKNIQRMPYIKIDCIKNLNDLVYYYIFMNTLIDTKDKTSVYNNAKYNRDSNDYIVMRENIKPVWEDPSNRNGGAFSIKVKTQDAYYLWNMLYLAICTETFCEEVTHMQRITGLFSSCIPLMLDKKNGTRVVSDNISFTVIKIWDNQTKTLAEFLDILPSNIKTEFQRAVEADDLSKSPNVRYVLHSTKSAFGNLK